MTPPDPAADEAPVQAPVHDPVHTQGEDGGALEQAIARKAQQHARATREGRHTIWFGMGMFGLVGWAVAVPTLAGVALGRWLDDRFADGPSWTIMGLLAGVALGSLNAWWWVRRTGLRHGDRKEVGDGN